MPYLNPSGLNRFWNKVKVLFGASLAGTADTSTYTINLKNGADTPVSLGNAVVIPSASLSTDSSPHAGLLTPTEKSKLAGIATGAEVNVQADWEETNTSSDAYINHKPSLAAVATSGSYTDLSNKPTIPTKVSDLTNDSGFVVSGDLATVATTGDYDDLTDKPTIPSANSTATNIKMDGIQSAGSLATFAKADHVHPSDTSRAPLASPTFTGTPAAPTAAAGTNTTQIATTAFVTAAVEAATSGAAAYKGALATDAAFTSLTNYTAGWYWNITGTFTHVDKDGKTITLESGNMVFANTTAATYNKANFDIVAIDVDSIPDSVIDSIVDGTYSE